MSWSPPPSRPSAAVVATPGCARLVCRRPGVSVCSLAQVARPGKRPTLRVPARSGGRRRSSGSSSPSRRSSARRWSRPRCSRGAPSAGPRADPSSAGRRAARRSAGWPARGRRRASGPPAHPDGPGRRRGGPRVGGDLRGAAHPVIGVRHRGDAPHGQGERQDHARQQQGGQHQSLTALARPATGGCRARWWGEGASHGVAGCVSAVTEATVVIWRSRWPSSGTSKL